LHAAQRWINVNRPISHFKVGEILMGRLSLRCLLIAAPLVLGASVFGQVQIEPNKAAAPMGPDLKDYRTVETAITTKVSATGPERAAKTGYFGVAVAQGQQGRVIVEDVQTDSPAAKAGVKKGDVIARIGDRAVASPEAFREWLQAYPAGETVQLSLVRETATLDVKATLIATSRPLVNKGGDGGGKGGGAGKGGGGKGGGAGPLTLWRKPVMRVGVVGIEFSDVKHNAKVTSKDWQEALFSKATYTDTQNPTGQAVHGSLNDYFLEQSGGAFHIEGKAFEWVNVGKKRADYIQGSGTSNKTAVLVDAMNKLAARDGKDAFKDLDGLVFIYAGDRHKANAGAVYYPHAGSVQHDAQRFPYFLTMEGGSTMTPVGGFAKIAALALGLPDLAARTENVGSRGLGAWCALSNPIATGRPQHLSAWAKEKIGWLKPAVIDPTVKQKLILAPIEDSPKECFKVLVRPNGSEYYLLENRRKKGFDAELPGEGLLIWRVRDDHPMLVESHGIDSPKAPETKLNMVPYPSEVNQAFTPDTMPSSRSPLGGGLPVHITQIQRLEDGRIAFVIGYEYR
jgi:M6 family metalloprotease-like protein